MITNLLLAIVCISCVTYVACLVVAKIYSPFWFNQPVYHTHDIYPKLCRQPFWKQPNVPTTYKGYYWDPKHIITVPVSELTLNTWLQMEKLLQGHYLDQEFILNTTSVSVMQNILYGDSYISLYWDTTNRIIRGENGLHNNVEEVYDLEVLCGCLCSRPLQVYFMHFSESNVKIHDIQWICTHDTYKDKPISRKLIQTHTIQHRIQSPTFSGGYIFLKHHDLCKAVVPLTTFNTYTFVLRDTRIHKLPINYKFRRLSTADERLWSEIYSQITMQYEIACLPELAQSLSWLKNERYSMYVTMYFEEGFENIHGLYVFENTNMSWDDDTLQKKNMIRLVASMVFGGKKVHSHDMNHLLFFRGFLNCMHSYIQKAADFGVLEIPCVSDNGILLEKWREKYETRNETMSAYYLYNMVYPMSPIPSSNIFIL